MVEEDVENYAALLVSEKSSYQIHSVTNTTILRADLERIAAAVLSEKIGLPLGVLPGDGEEFNGADLICFLLRGDGMNSTTAFFGIIAAYYLVLT